MDIIQTNNSHCGSGKTYDATRAACNGITENRKTCIAVPSRKLAKQVQRHALHDFPELKARITCFVSNPQRGETAISRITKYLMEHNGQGSLLIVTHAAIQMIAHRRNKVQWHLIADEEITSECHIPVKLKRPETRAALCDLFRVHPWDDIYSVLEAVDHGKIMDIRDTLHDDQIDELFAPLTMRLLPSSCWNLFVKTAQWQEFVGGRINRFDVHGLLHPQLLDGFASVKVMAANIEDTLMAAYWRKVGRNMLRATPKPVKPIGDRLTIKYLPVPRWSKRLRDTVVDEVSGTTVGEMYALLCANEALKHDPNPANHLYITNLDNTDVEFGGVQLPAIPHGMNDYQNATVCAIFTALNRQPAHEVFLRHMLGISERQIRRATITQVSYQAACRGIIRKADSIGRFLLLAPDQASAEDCADILHFKGCEMVPLITPYELPDMQPKPPGRPSSYATDEARDEARRDQARERKRQQRFRLTMSRKNTNSISDPRDMESDDIPSLLHCLHIWARADLDGIATIRPETNGIGGFTLSHWRHRGDKDGLGCDPFIATDLFATRLRQWQGWEYPAKKQVPMFSPTLFDAGLSNDHNRGKENALVCRGIILDIERSCIRPDEWTALLPELQMTIYSSFNHTDREPRYRVCIPCTHYVSPFVHEMLGRIIEGRLVQMGYGDQQSPRPHGLDTGKFERTSLFYRPSHRSEMFLSSHLDGDRLPLNPYKWLDACPREVWMDNIHVEVMVSDPAPPARAIYPNGGGLVQYGLNRWRETGPLVGGHRKFWYLAKCLYDGGLDRATVGDHLRRAKDIAHNPAEREAEIPGILDGFFG
jgi:hypothetical protein